MIKNCFIAVAIMVITVLTSCSNSQYKLNDNLQISEIGIPVKSVNWVRLHEGTNRDGQPCIFATMGQTADNLFVLHIDPITGELSQYISQVEKSNYPTATLLSKSGKLYIGAAYAGHLLCYDPVENRLDDLGAINPGKASFPCGIVEDDDGILWIGSYGTADLTSYDPETGTFTRRGRMDDVDMYNYPMVNVDGMICNKIMMTKPHLVVFDPKTGTKKVVGPIAEKGKDSLTLIRGQNNRVYIKSSLGNYSIEGFKAVNVETIPENTTPQPPKSVMSYRFADAGQQLYRKLEVTSTGGETRTFDLDYEAAGTEIFYVHNGPDDCIYGSSILPLHLYRYDPSNSGLDDLGKCSAAAGEAYSMANLDGSIYISSYPGARVSVYDPSRPYEYGVEIGSNPRELGRIDDISYRPRTTLAGPLGRVWLVSLPDYGRWGGPLSWYDPKTEEKKAYYEIAGDGSCYTMAYCEKQGLLAVGTSIYGGSGTQPKVEQAVLFLWDCEAEKKIWEGTLDRQVNTFNALVSAPDGRLFGTVTGGDTPELFVFDPESRIFTDRISLPHGGPLDLGLQNGPNGYLYGFTRSCFYRIDPVTLSVEELLHEDDSFHIAGPINGDSVYFAQDVTLKMIHLFR
ncbi:hypothetical protein ACFL60_01760 [Candidatus Omnitrophota bacterium]